MEMTGGPWMARTGSPVVSKKPWGKHNEAMDGEVTEGQGSKQQNKEEWLTTPLPT